MFFLEEREELPLLFSLCVGVCLFLLILSFLPSPSHFFLLPRFFLPTSFFFLHVFLLSRFLFFFLLDLSLFSYSFFLISPFSSSFSSSSRSLSLSLSLSISNRCLSLSGSLLDWWVHG